MELLVDENRGIYIPQYFVSCYLDSIVNHEELKEDIHICHIGPDHNDYWDAWSNIVDDCIILISGKECVLFENQDLWALTFARKNS